MLHRQSTVRIDLLNPTVPSEMSKKPLYAKYEFVIRSTLDKYRRMQPTYSSCKHKELIR